MQHLTQQPKKIKAIGFGAGGHAKVLLEMLGFFPEIETIGLFDKSNVGKTKHIFNTPVLGNDAKALEWKNKGVSHFFIGVGSTGYTNIRTHLYQQAIAHSFQPLTIVHPKAYIAPSSTINAGFNAMANAAVNTDAQIGINVTVNMSAIVEHDCVIEDHVFIASGVHLASTVQVGRGCHLGIGATIKQCVKIGSGSIVGAGAVVVKDVPAGVLVVGSPARIIKKLA